MDTQRPTAVGRCPPGGNIDRRCSVEANLCFSYATLAFPCRFDGFC